MRAFENEKQEQLRAAGLILLRIILISFNVGVLPVTFRESLCVLL